MNYAHLDYIVSRIQQRLEAGIATDESRVDFDLIKDAVHAARTALISEKFKVLPFIPKAYYQPVCCVPLECRSIVCDGVDSGQVEYVADIPAVLANLGRRAFRFVGTADWRQSADYIPTLTEAAVRPFPFSGKKPFVYSLRGDSRLVFANLPVAGMDLVCVEAIFSNPEDELIKSCLPDHPYPVGAGDIQMLEDLTVERYKIMVGLQPDLSVDAVPNK